jgi:hypothetical protein
MKVLMSRQRQVEISDEALKLISHASNLSDISSLFKSRSSGL